MRSQKGYVFHRYDSWFVRFMDDVLEDGVIRRKLVCKKLEVPYGGAYRTKKSAQPFVDKILAPINAGSLDVRSTMPVTEFVEKHYLPNYVEELRPASRKQFRDTWKNHLAPRMGQRTLRSFRTVDAQNILNSIAEQGTLGRSSMRHCKSALSGIFKEAKRLGILDGLNPVQDTKIKARDSEGQEDETYAYSLTEVKAMLAMLDEPAKTIILTAALTGLRKSEIRGLTWADYNRKELRVRHSVWNSTVSEPKTKKSRAPIPVVKILADALDAHQAREGKLAQPGLPIFQAGNGKPLNLDNLSRRIIAPVCDWHGWHGFRRGVATNLHLLKIDDVTIQRILRHSNVGLTQNIYIKTPSESQLMAMDALSAKFETTNNVLATPADVRPN